MIDNGFSPKGESPLDFADRLAGLSPAKRALLELRLRQKAPEAPGKPTIPRRANTDPAPLSFSQQRLWFLAQLEPDSSAYNQPKAIRIQGALNVEALQQSLDAIVARHEALRTTFVAVDGNPVQVPGTIRPVELPVIDLRQWQETDREAEMQRRLVAATQRPFDLSRDLMLRAALVQLNENDYVLLLVTHHIASDGWSSGILSRELAALYEVFSTGQPSPLPELPIQYADFAAWQRNWLQGKVLEEQLSYWKKQLGGALPPLELPTDRSRPAVQRFRGAKQSVVLPTELTEALKELTQRQGATLFMTLLAAFQTLLHRYTGQDDIVVGSPIAGRNRVETEGLIGFFVNTLVLRSDLSRSPTFRELLSRVREIALGAYAHQELPFEKLVEELQPERDLSHSPLFQVLFAFQNVPRTAAQLQGLTISPLIVGSETAKFDLSLYCVETGGAITGTLEYNTDLFEAATITRMLGHLQVLLEGIVTDPDQPISELPILTDQEQKQLLVEWNDTQKPYPKDKCIHQLFEAQVERTPEAIALVSGEKQLTYRDLNRRTNQLAHHLAKLGVEPEVLVGICMERSLDMVVAVLGILKAGGAYVPLDPSYPKERLAFMLEDTRASVLLTQQRLVGNLPEHSAHEVCLDTSWEAIEQESKENPANKGTADRLAYVIYTSGSTGKPKGCMNTHLGVSNRLLWMQDAYHLDCTDRVLQKTPFSFDVSVWEFFWPLLTGATEVVARPGGHQDPGYLVKLILEQNITTLHFVPSMLQAFLQAEGVQDCSNLRRVFCSGEALPYELQKRFFACLDAELHNLYGPTEAAVDVTYWACQRESDRHMVPIGRPVANTQIFILNPQLKPVPAGVRGELYVGGVQLARGYLNRPELTVEKFISSPFSNEPGARLYNTGDLARYLPDGNIEFIGRIDNQVKIRGYRIELGEIEAVLRQHPTVRESVVLAREDTPGNKRLVAYIVTDHQQPLTISELRSFLTEKLPDYMVPSAFVMLDALPLTSNGKVDHKALPKPDQRKFNAEKPLERPREALEIQLTKLWERVLDIKPIGVKDNFFELGGHSLLAVRLFAQIKKTLGKNLPLATLFQAPTIEQQASLLRQRNCSSPWTSLVPIQPDGFRPPFFCVHAHEGHVLYFRYLANHLGPDQPFYGLQAQGLDGNLPPHRSMEEMAAHYIKEIQTIQPEGPYFLGANCSGGQVAFEMAQQLHAQGQKVAVLALIDCHAPGCHTVSPNSLSRYSKVYRLIQKVDRHLIHLSLLGSKEKRIYARDAARWILKNRIKPAITKLGHKVLGTKHTSSAFSEESQEPNFVLSNGYRPTVYPDRINLFRPIKQMAGVNHDPKFGWGRLASGGVECHIVPGYHGIIHEPQVRILAEKLRVCLQKARTGYSEKQL